MGKNIRGPVVIIVSLTLAAGCSLIPSGGDEDAGSSSGTISASQTTSPQETRTETATETETETATSDTEEDGTSATATAAEPTASSTTDGSSGAGEGGPEETVEDFATALSEEDFEAACEAFDPAIVESLEQFDQSCGEQMEENWEELDVPADASIDIRDSRISADGRDATVTVRNRAGEDHVIDLTLIEGEWRISLEG